jgi:hypothetical protein
MRRPLNATGVLTEVELALLAGQNLSQIEAAILASSGLREESQSAAGLDGWGFRQRASRPAPFLPPPA